MHYEGKLDDGTVFDSSYKRGKPIGINIGIGRVIRGWDIGVMSMELGEKAELRIESNYGYGDKGRPGSIPGGATMTFTVELLAINEKEAESKKKYESETKSTEETKSEHPEPGV